MRFLADECFDARLVASLREEGHDVLAAQQAFPGATDEKLLTRAHAEGRILLTEDTDFGELVFRLQRPAKGIILLRLEAHLVSKKWLRLREVLTSEKPVEGHFVVIEQRRARFRPMPPFD